MTTEFGTSADSGQNVNEGMNFGQTDGADQTSTPTDNQGIVSEDLDALRRRDAAAQEHIPRLESENQELRDKLAEMESQLASATTIDEALDRISNQGGQESLTTDAVTQIVDQVLEQKQTQSQQENNWQQVMGTLTDTFGDWSTADTKVQERAAELDISLQDATMLARNNPKAFLQLFVPTTSTRSASSGTVRSGGSGQSVADLTSAQQVRDAEYYRNLRKTNPNEYWKVETQMQLRRDLYSD